MRYILPDHLFQDKRIVILIGCLLFFTMQLHAQQIISFPDPYVRAALLAQYGEGTNGKNNGAILSDATSIDFSKLYSQSDPANQGVIAVTSLVVYPIDYVPGTLTGVELLSGLSQLTVNGYDGLLFPAAFVNLPLRTLDLSINSLTSLPANLNGLTLLESLNISQNALNDIPTLPAGLIHLIADHNDFSFVDLEPYASLFSNTLDYAEQTVFTFSPSTIELTAGQTLSITAAGYINGVNNRYQWFKDGQKVSTVSSDPSLTMTNVRAGDAGGYTCQVTNTLLAGLTISSDFLVVSVTPPALLSSDQLWGMTSRTGVDIGGTVFNMNAVTGNATVVKQLTTADGIFPQGDLMQASDGFLYGMTARGGTNSGGTIFRMYKDGTQFQKIYDFDLTIGSYPRGTLVEANDGYLYGMTERGAGQSLTGTVFRISKGLTPGYTHLHEFAFQALPLGSLIQADDGDLYGLTQTGAVGGGNMGSIFKIKTDGSGFKVLHQFDETKLDGHQPNGSLLQASNGSLYGMTAHGGENSQGDGGGTIFKIETDGQGFRKLWNTFDSPKGSLIQGSNGDLYGMAEGGSWTLYGYIFKIDLRGDNLQTLHVFTQPTGTYPSGSLTEAPNGEMYGMTTHGGANDKGVIFKIRPDGSNYTKLYDFDIDGNSPMGSLFFSRKINQTITFARLAERQISDSPFPLIASSTSGLPLTFSSSDPSVAAVSGNTITLTGIGSAVITASQEGDVNFDAAKNVERVLIVTKAKQNQSITFNALAAKKAGDVNFSLTAFSDSGLPVSYASSNEAVAIVTGDIVTIVSSGTTMITASQAGNEDYFTALEVPRLLTVIKADQTIIFNPIDAKKLEEDVFALDATSSSSLIVSYTTQDDKVSIQGSSVTLLRPGLITITAHQSGNDKFNPATDVKQSFCILPATPVITSSFVDPDVPVLTSSSSTGNQWYLDGAMIDNANNASYMVSQQGQYTVRVTIESCSSLVSNPSVVLVTALEKANATSVLKAYPNPARESVTLFAAISVGQRAHITIYNSVGKLMDSGGEELLNRKILVDQYTAGIYIAILTIGDQIFSYRFVKK